MEAGAGRLRYLVSLGAEVSLKGRGTRAHLERLIWDNLLSRAERFGLSLRVEPFRGRFLLFSDSDPMPLLKSHFGLSRAALFFGIKELYRWVVDVPFSSFEVAVDRCADRGIALEERRRLVEFLSLRSSRGPHLEVRLEFHDGLSFALVNPVKLPGGLPVGCGGRVLHLFSGGPDSVLSALLLMRRGQRVCLAFFDDGVGDRFDAALYAARRVAFFAPGMEVELFRVSHRGNLEAMAEAVSRRKLCLFCKASMLLLSCRMAEALGFDAVSTGEILGEQASQTLYSMLAVSRCAPCHILRPVVCFNKEEVFEGLRRLGVGETFSMPACPFAPRRPATRARGDHLLERLRRIPLRLSYERVVVRAGACDGPRF